MAVQDCRSDLRTGLIVNGRLRLEQRIGRGAEAEVWCGRHLQLGAAVAIKFPVPRRGGPITERRFARLLCEATMPMRVDSPHVVRVLECALSPELGPYIVMELVPGWDLFEHLDRFGPLGICETAAIVAQLCLALAALHEAGVFHGDVKPENVIVSPTRERVHATLVDFGVASGGPATQGEDCAQGVWGTPAYLSPERLVGWVGADAQGDLWSLAVVGYQCLVGHAPFRGRTLSAVWRAVIQQAFVPPSRVRGDVPARLDEWFRRSFLRTSSQRFASAFEMREALIAACSPLGLGSRLREGDCQLAALRPAS